MKILSVVVPIFNERASIEELLIAVKENLDKKNIPFEVILIDDGSSDSSWAVIERTAEEYEQVKGVKLSRNVGQHNACIAGFEHSSGDFVVTIDADMQDNPDVLPRIYERLKSGYDIVGCRRKLRRDNLFRRFVSMLMHWTLSNFTKLRRASSGEFSDFGCMTRGYRRWVIEKVIKGGGKSIYIPTFAAMVGGNFCEIEIEHRNREKGRSKYSVRRLLALYFDMITDISLFPVQVISFLGIFFAFAGFSLGIVIFLRRIFIGPEVEGVFTLFAFLFVLTGILLVSVGLIGEYVGRIFREVSKRPRFIVAERSGFRKDLRIGVFAYSEVGYTCLQRLIDIGENIVFVVTHIDSKNENIWFRSVSELAHRFNIPLLKPESINEEKFIDVVDSFKPDVIFSFYFRKIFGRRLLSIPQYGCINVHGSLLPQYRGRAPVNWAIINGEKETGTTFHFMTTEVDAGPIIAQTKIMIDDNDTGLSLTKKIASESVGLLEEIVEALHEDNLTSTPQDKREATYFGKRTPSMGKIEWTWGSEKLFNYMRGLAYPFPGAFFICNKRKCILWKGEGKECDSKEVPGMILGIGKDVITVKTGSGCFNVQELKVEGKRLTASEFARYFQLNSGDLLGG